MITNAGQSKTISMQYRVPVKLDSSYQVYVQKQPGLEVKSFTFSMQKPTDREPIESFPVLTESGNNLSWTGDFINDLPIKVNFK
ncbi:hypothetical protein KW791_03810 [Candidatus Parcubacteria bacterium]|nr:hypothetical protein [Candidatus Parcubacteria bacterium]